jgi:hypothetical protein
MNLKSLARYDISSDNQFIIDVNIPGPDDLFEKFDENSSFYKKDLNSEFVRHLLECVDEIGLKNKFMIKIGLPKDQEKKTDEGDIAFSFKQYFEYSIFICQKKIKTVSFRLLLHVVLATITLLLMMAFNVADSIHAVGFLSLVESGLPAAVWVLLLTGLSRFLFRSMTQRARIKIYRALKNTPVEFYYKEKQKDV